MECEYCGRIFSSSSSLSKHKKTAKYCIKSRGKKPPEYRCELCDALCSSKYTYNSHTKKCKEIYEKISKKIKSEYQETIHKLETHIQKLEDRLENIAIKGATKSTTTNNIIIQNLTPLTKEKLESNADKLSIADTLQGGIGYAKFALENGLKDSVICSNLSRKIAVYKNEEGKIEVDPGLRTVSSKFFSSIEGKNSEIADVYAEGKEEDDPFIKSCKLVKASEMKTGVEKAVNEDNGEIYTDFSGYICQKTYQPNVKVDQIT